MSFRKRSGTQSELAGAAPFAFVWPARLPSTPLVWARKRLRLFGLSLLLLSWLVVSASPLGCVVETSSVDCCGSFFFPPRKLSRVPRCLSEMGWAAAASSITPAPFGSGPPILLLGGEFSAGGDGRRHVGEGVALSREYDRGVKAAISGAKVDSKSSPC